MKKTIAAILILLSVLSLTACSGRVPATVLSPDDLPGKTIGYLENSLTQYLIAGAFSDEKTVSCPSAADAADRLKSGSLDCIIADRADASVITRKARGIKILNDPATSIGLGFLCARARSDLAGVLGKNITALEDGGVLEKIVNNYTGGKSYEYSPSETEFPETFTVAVFVCGEPYVYRSDDGELTGLEIDITHAVCDLIGINAEFIPLSREDAETYVFTGRADFAIGGFYPDGTNSELGVVSAPYYTAEQVIITRK